MKWQDFYDKWIVRFLIKEPLKHISYLLSHGFFHFIMCILVGIGTGIWWYINVTSSNTTMHDIILEVKPPYTQSTKKDIMNTLTIDFIIDSDSLLKTDNKYSSKIEVSYEYTYARNDSTGEIMNKDSTKILLYSNPFLDDLYVRLDSTNMDDGQEDTYKKFYTPDSALEVQVFPANNISLPSGGKFEGRQEVNFYSNKLGRTENDSYYNYFIDFNILPEVNTEGAKGIYSISVQIGDVTTNRGYHHVGNKRLLYQYVYPQPDIFTNGYLYYYKEQTLKKVEDNHCIIIQAIDIDAMNKNNRKSLVYSVLVGTGAALFLDILIQLVRELKNLNRRKEEELEQQENEGQRNENQSESETEGFVEDGSVLNEKVTDDSQKETSDK